MLAYKCGPAFAGLTGAVIAAYTAFTIGITQWRTRFRQAMNKADSEAGKQAMDSLINFETVKLYGNEEHELKRYDRCLAGAALLEPSHALTDALISPAHHPFCCSRISGMESIKLCSTVLGALLAIASPSVSPHQSNPATVALWDHPSIEATT